jgi:hypothetical protein
MSLLEAIGAARKDRKPLNLLGSIVEYRAVFKAPH